MTQSITRSAFTLPTITPITHMPSTGQSCQASIWIKKELIIHPRTVDTTATVGAYTPSRHHRTQVLSIGLRGFFGARVTTVPPSDQR